MLKKLSFKLALIYAILIIAVITVLDIVLIYSYQKVQYSKMEPGLVALGRTIAYRVGTTLNYSADMEFAVVEYSKNIDGRILILGKWNNVLADSLNEYKGKTITNKEIRDVLNGSDSSIGYYSNNGRKVMMLAVPIGERSQVQGAVLVSRYSDDMQSNIDTLKILTMCISLIVIILAFIISYFIGKGITRPINKLILAAKEIHNKKLGTQVKVSRNDEIGLLASTFNEMSNELYCFEQNRRRFISDVAHEIRTPLSSIRALVESLIYGKSDMSTIKEYLYDIDGEIERLSNLVKSLLTVTRLDELKLKKEKINLNDEVNDIVRLFSASSGEKNILISNYCDSSVHILADKYCFKEIIINLLDNAIKYSLQDGSIIITCEKLSEGLIISFIDKGVGIPLESLEFIFDNFYRVDKSRDRKNGGSGIGLHIVKKLVEMHGWSIRVTSEEGKGTTFFIDIPGDF